MLGNFSRICTLAILMSTITPGHTIKADNTSIVQIFIGIPTTLVGIVAFRKALKNYNDSKECKSGNDAFFSAKSIANSLTLDYTIFGASLAVAGLAHVILGLKK